MSRVSPAELQAGDPIGKASTAGSQDEQRLDKCNACGLALPLRPPRRAEQSVDWVCSSCGARYRAVLNENSSAELVQHVRPSEVHFDRANLTHPPQAIAAFIAKMLPEAYKGPERRASRRHECVVPVPVLPVRSDLRAAGETFMAMTRNISTTGLALISSRAVGEQFLAVELPGASGQRMQVVMRVLRCRSIGRFYEIAGQFITRMSD